VSRRSQTVAAVALLWIGLMAGTSRAHELAREAVGHWEWEPITIATLLVSAWVYAAGTRNVWQRAGVGRGVRRWQAVCFGTGLVSLAIALLSPVAWLSTVLFSIHMTQHEILMLVSAPLLVFGYPVLAMLWALPRRTRESLGRVAQLSAIARSWHALTGPLTVFVLHAMALWVWHVPRLYEAALRSDAVHAVQHLSFVLTAALFWWAMVHGRYGRLGYGVAVLYIFLTAMHSSVLGALMAIAPEPWYPGYARAGRPWGVDPLADQQLAGLLMWVPSALVFIVFGLALFAAWLGESDKRAALGSVPRGTPRIAVRLGGHDDAA
jgi:cytochrome c oxidase assembly factor CtaG